MKTTQGFEITPSPKRAPIDRAALDAFAAGGDTQEPAGQGVAPSAGASTASVEKTPQTPDWTVFDNKRRFPSFTMRFTDLESAQLKHIASITPDSMHEFCLRAIRKELDAFFK